MKWPGCTVISRRQVFVAEQEVHLTPTEYRLLATLIRHAGKVVTHRQLLKDVWGPDSVHETHYVRVFMGAIAAQDRAGPSPAAVVAHGGGIGYRLVAE